jgi:hypothetical protein
VPLKIQETRFWKEKSVENVVTPTAQATLVLIEGEIWDPSLCSFVSIYGRNKNCCLHNASRGIGSNHPCLDSVTLQIIISFRQKATTMAANVSSDDAHDKSDLKLRASGYDF